MLHENLKSEMFVELSDEQQEIVAGGQRTITDTLSTFYQAQRSLVGLNVVQTSGPGGSAIGSSFTQDLTEINTGANRTFGASF